jgi:hypothetical protein
MKPLPAAKSHLTRRRFLKAIAGATGLTLARARGEAIADLKPTVCNPLLRTPLALIIDDACPVINKAWYWINARHEWRQKFQPDKPPSGWEVHYEKLGAMVNTIPAAFAEEWGDWCGEQGIKGKYSMVPFPAGVGRIDQGFPGFPGRELTDWLRVTKEIIHKNFDITPEMITHTRVVDLKTWQLTDAWEQYEWIDPPVDLLTEYVTAAMQLLKNAGIACDGVTSPGVFGSKKEEAYARAVLDASLHVNNNPRPFYFLWSRPIDPPEVPLWHVDKAQGRAVASVIPCTSDWFGATGYDLSDPDKFITEDLQRGRLPIVLRQELPTILLGHWPCFYANNGPGFKTLKEVKRRLDAFDPDRTRTRWMKTSEIGRYWMARQLSEVAIEPGAGANAARLRIETAYPTPDFTLALNTGMHRVQRDGIDLPEVKSRRDFRSGTFLVEAPQSFIAFDLPAGTTKLALTLA